MVATLLETVYNVWIKSKEYLPLLGPCIALTIFAYNHATRKRKTLQIEEFRGKACSYRYIQLRLDYLKFLLKSRRMLWFSFKWSNDFSNACIFQKNRRRDYTLDSSSTLHLIFRNSSTEEIKVSDYEQPFRIHFSIGDQLDYRIAVIPVVTVPANLNIRLNKTFDSVTGEPVLVIDPVLLNPGDSFTLKLVSDFPLNYRLSYRIAGLKNNLLRKKWWNGRHYIFLLNLMVHFCYLNLFVASLVCFEYNMDRSHKGIKLYGVVAAIIIAVVLACYLAFQLWSWLFNSEKVVRREVIRGNASGIAALRAFQEEEQQYEKKYF